jgi:hypothetical protein
VGRTKGTSIVEIVKLLRARGEEAQALLPASQHGYLEERILESNWYPEEDLVALLRVTVELLGAPEEETLALLGAEAMRRNRSGAYAHLFEGRSGERILRVGDVVWRAMHDTGKLRFSRDAVGRGRCELLDFDTPSGEMCGILAGYGIALLEAAGYRDVGVAKDLCVLRGDDCCAWSFTWTEPS